MKDTVKFSLLFIFPLVAAISNSCNRTKYTLFFTGEGYFLDCDPETKHDSNSETIVNLIAHEGYTLPKEKKDVIVACTTKEVSPFYDYSVKEDFKSAVLTIRMIADTTVVINTAINWNKEENATKFVEKINTFFYGSDKREPSLLVYGARYKDVNNVDVSKLKEEAKNNFGSEALEKIKEDEYSVNGKLEKKEDILNYIERHVVKDAGLNTCYPLSQSVVNKVEAAKQKGYEVEYYTCAPLSRARIDLTHQNGDYNFAYHYQTTFQGYLDFLDVKYSYNHIEATEEGKTIVSSFNCEGRIDPEGN